LKVFPLAEASHSAAVAAPHDLTPAAEAAARDGLPDEAQVHCEFPVAAFVPVLSPRGELAPAESEAEPIALSYPVDGLELPASLAASLADACSLAQHSVACSDDSLAVEAELAAAPGAFLVVELLATDYFLAARHRGYSPAHSIWAPHSDCFLAVQVGVRLRDYFPVLRGEVQHSDYFPAPPVVARHSGCFLARLAVARRHGYFRVLPGEVQRSDWLPELPVVVSRSDCSPVLPLVVRPRDYFLVLLVDSRVLQDGAPPDSEPLRYLPGFLHAPLAATVVPE